MSARTRAGMALALVGLLALMGAGPAFAKKGHRKLLQPLNQYVVSGRVNTDELARSGFDLNEASVTGKKGRFYIVATAKQAGELRQKGARRRRTSACSRTTRP